MAKKIKAIKLLEINIYLYLNNRVKPKIKKKLNYILGKICFTRSNLYIL